MVDESKRLDVKPNYYKKKVADFSNDKLTTEAPFCCPNK